MPDNYYKAKCVVLSFRKRLNSQPETMAKYCEKIDKAIKEGHLVPVQKSSEFTSSSNSTPKYYIPHFHTSQAKFRVVYDAAREFQGVSLNQLLARVVLSLCNLCNPS